MQFKAITLSRGPVETSLSWHLTHTHEVDVLRGGPQSSECVLRHLARNGQEAEDAAAAIVDQYHLQSRGIPTNSSQALLEGTTSKLAPPQCKASDSAM